MSAHNKQKTTTYERKACPLTLRTSRPAKELAELKTVLVISPCVLKDDDVRGYLENKAESGGGPVEDIDRFGRLTCLVHFRSHEDAMNVVRRERHAVEGLPLLVAFLYDQERRCVYSGSNTVSWQDGDAVDVPFTCYQDPCTVLVTGADAAGSVFTTVLQIGSHFEAMGYEIVTPHVLLSAGIAFVRFEDGRDARQLANKQITKLSTGDEPAKTLRLFLFGGILPCDGDDTETLDDLEEIEIDAPDGPRTTHSDGVTGADCLGVPSGTADEVQTTDQEEVLPAVIPASEATQIQGTSQEYTGLTQSFLKEELATMKAEIQAKFDAAENRSKRELREQNAKIQAEVNARVHDQATLQAKTTQLADQFQADTLLREDIVAGNIQMLSELSGHIFQMNNDVSSLQKQAQSSETLLKSLQAEVQTNKADIQHAKSFQDIHGRMQSTMLSETQRHLTAEITTLQGDIRGAKEWLARLESKVTSLANNLTQQEGDGEDVHVGITVDNASSDCESD